MAKNNVWKCKLLFPTDTLQQKIEITDLKPFFVGENTSGLRLLHSSVCVCVYYIILSIYIYIYIYTYIYIYLYIILYIHTSQNIVSEIFVDAFSKLKPCRTPTGPPIVLDVTPGEPQYFLWQVPSYKLVSLYQKYFFDLCSDSSLKKPHPSITSYSQTQSH